MVLPDDKVVVLLLPSDRSGVVTGPVTDWDRNVLGALDRPFFPVPSSLPGT
ncbi:hypothetical protein JK359_28675 [Streptomyces actinomycinicus]|uniref:Uncharacterized protein n=1 Tax=Streptomyces actinomycinicus TaxID=1695166 RepID=A0A937EPQ8_9ACTN|nr:hypothetical protein [Streptomyces actinomycinicus]MBL1085895.1 hypothetical protein [Streptomyces actinomycinicus]